MNPRLVILVGPKGAGKTTLGGVLERNLGIPFLRVEPIWLELGASRGPVPDEVGFARVAEEIERRLLDDPILVIESTAASPAFAGFVDRLEKRCEVLFVRVTAPPEVCVERVRTRERRDHIPVSDDRVREVNAKAFEVDLPWAAVIDNSAPVDERELTTALKGLLEREPD
jgi:predicted kinase